MIASWRGYGVFTCGEQTPFLTTVSAEIVISSALTERRRRSPPNPRIRADFSSMEPHFDPPILLPTVLGVVRSDRQCVSVSFDQGRHNALSLHLFGDCLGALRRNYRIRPG